MEEYVLDNIHLRHKFSKVALKQIKKSVHFDINTNFKLDWKECQKNNFPYFDISTKGDWFTVRLSFDHCDYKMNDTALNHMDKDFDNSIGFIEGYKLAKGQKPPRYSSDGPGKIWINYPPIHKKYFLKLIKKFLDYGVQRSYHEPHK